MNDEAATEATDPNAEQAPAPETESGWMAFNERMVMLQFDQPYIGVNVPSHQPSTDPTGGVRATPILTGTLLVAPNGNGGVMLVLRMQVSEKDYALVQVKAENVLFCTHVNESRIIA